MSTGHDGVDIFLSGMTGEQEAADRQVNDDLSEKLRSHLQNLVVGKPLFQKEGKLESMKRMFPGGPEAPAVATNIYSVTMRDLGEHWPTTLHTIAREWAGIVGDPCFVADPSTYHVSIAVPQDIAAHEREALGILERPDQALAPEHLQSVHDLLLGVAHRKPRFELKPVGIRAGDDGALIFLFGFNPTLWEIRREVVGLTKIVTNGTYTGRFKPFAAITLNRSLKNPIVTDEMLVQIAAFVDAYEVMEGPPCAVGAISFTHETHWMLTGEDFRHDIALGTTSAHLQEELRQHLGLPELQA